MIELMKASQPDQSEDSIRRKLRALTTPRTYPDPMPPLWKAFPDIGRWPSIGWRMGPGDDYYHAFADWFRALPEARQKEYVSAHPEPPEFSGLYDALLKHL